METNTNPAPAAPAVAVVTPKVRRGQAERFRKAVLDAEASLRRFEGFRGLSLIEPSAAFDPHVVVFQFESPTHLAAWEQSDIRREHLSHIDDLTEAPSRESRLTGLEFWFRPPGDAPMRPPPPWKMCIVAIGVIYPTGQLLGWLLGPALNPLPGLLSALLMTVLLVLLMTYALMPLAVRLLKRWLYPAAP